MIKGTCGWARYLFGRFVTILLDFCCIFQNQVRTPIYLVVIDEKISFGIFNLGMKDPKKIVIESNSTTSYSH